ncbi:TetR/AcrR family transcriptional regulator [Pengzhenrongella phosphoraccumulans]|uniref:TetR/AcrR family transcriptional regulator n=1 Tax=Pengzhenrongella phosphoraccumulans TaxID=3114394 RepID=UPI00388DDA88
MLRRTGADTKREILTAATRLFSDYGYRGTSLADIAHEINFSKASVLYHFASKEALLAELIAPAAADLTALIERLGTLPPEQSRRAALEGYTHLAVTYREAVAILQTECLLLQDPHFHTIGLQYEQLVEALAGDDPDAERRIAAVMVIVGTAAACTQPTGLSPEQLQPTLVTVALRTLGLPADAPPG